jgi:DNA-binding transcriptional LysR family regulator
VVPGGEGISASLETGEVDVAIAAQVDQREPDPIAGSWPGLVRRTLFRDRFVCLIRADHPAVARSGRARRSPRALTLETYAALSHALVSPAGAGPGLVDEALERHELRRRIALRIPHFYSALAIVARSDLILTAPSALAALASRDLRLVALPPPVALPEHAIQMVWHERFSNEPGHRWLRELVAEVAREAHATTGSRRRS